MPYIYKIENDINNKIYIGKTYRTIEQRFQEHCREYSIERSKNRPLYLAMNKYGIEHFHVSLVEETDQPEEREKYWIEYYQSFKNGYNATVGGDGQPYVDYQAICDLYQQGLYQTEIQKFLHYDLTTIRKALDMYNVSKEERVLRGKNYSQRSVIMRDKNTKEILHYFSSIQEAANFINKPTTHIKDVCHNRRKTAYGYIWEFADNKNSLSNKNKRIRCVETNEIFNSSAHVNKKYPNINSNSVRRCCTGAQKSAGKHPETGEKLHWEYIE